MTIAITPKFEIEIADDPAATASGQLTPSRFAEGSNFTMATARIVGRVTADAGAAEELTATPVRTFINVADGANNYAHPTGDGNLHVPATSTTNDGKFLKAGSTAGSIAWANAVKADFGLGNVDNTSDAAKPISTLAQSALDAKAPLASPDFTGNPTAPTQTAGNNTTRLATTAFVTAAVAALIDGAPGAIDTLNELAAALGDDPNFAATVNAAIAARLIAANNLSDLANAATALTNLGLTANGAALVKAANYAAMKTLLAITVADITNASVNGRSLISAADYAAMRTLLGLVIGTNVQAFDANTAKTNAAQTWSAAQQFGQVAGTVTAVAALALDCALGNEFTKTIAGNSTFTVSNVPSSKAYHLRLVLTYTSGTITWFSGVNWVGGAAPTFTGGKVYEIIFTTQNGGTTWRAAAGEYAA